MAVKEKVRLRAARAKDKFGDPTGPVPDWREVPGCTVVPRESQDYEQRGPIVISGFMVRLPAGTPIVQTDDVEVRGSIYAVDGEVADYLRKGKIVYVTRAN